MKYPALLVFFSTLFFLNLSSGHLTDTLYALNAKESALNLELRDALTQDGFLTEASPLKIEFEYHDLFINEEIPIQMESYQQLLHNYGVQPGPQRQIHLLVNGSMVIGDFDDYGRMMGEPVRLMPKV